MVIFRGQRPGKIFRESRKILTNNETGRERIDRKSTRLNSSHLVISYAVFCLKKKKKKPPSNTKTHSHVERRPRYSYLQSACPCCLGSTNLTSLSAHVHFSFVFSFFF